MYVLQFYANMQPNWYFTFFDFIQALRTSFMLKLLIATLYQIISHCTRNKYKLLVTKMIIISC